MTDHEKIESISKGKSSLDVARWHMENSLLKGASWSVALCISLHHNKEYGYAFPTIELLTRLMPYDVRTINRGIRDMKDSGEWAVVSGRGGPRAKLRGLTAQANRYYPRFQNGHSVMSPENNDMTQGHVTLYSELTQDQVTSDSDMAQDQVTPHSDLILCPTKGTSLKKGGFSQNNFNEPLSAKLVLSEEKISAAAKTAGRESIPNSEIDKKMEVIAKPEKTKTSPSTTEIKKLHIIKMKDSALQFSLLLPGPLSLNLAAEINKSARAVNRLYRALELAGPEGQEWAIKNSVMLVTSGETVISVIGWLESWGLVNNPSRKTRAKKASSKFSTQLGNPTESAAAENVPPF